MFPSGSDAPAIDGGAADIWMNYPGIIIDTKRAEVLATGGGHAGYSGNEIYSFSLSTLTYARKALPTKMNLVNGNGKSVDLTAPAATHGYYGYTYLESLDRFVKFPSVTWQQGNWGTEPDGRPTGPYFFDLTKADANKVGGVSGSGWDSSRAGSGAWSNRRSGYYGTSPSGWQGQNGSAAISRNENGIEHIYITEGGGYARNLWRIRFMDPNDPSKDKWQKVGENNLNQYDEAASAYMPNLNAFFIVVPDFNGFAYWPLPAPGAANPASVSGVRISFTNNSSGAFSTSTLRPGIAYRYKNGKVYGWQDGTSVLRISPPASLQSSGWVIERDNSGSATQAPGRNGMGGPSMFRWFDALDVGIGVAGGSGDVWVYKPSDWVAP